MKNDYLWINDPHLVPQTPTYIAAKNSIRFSMISREKDGGKATLAKESPEFQKQYADWLATQD
jgi:hypothetical protein